MLIVMSIVKSYNALHNALWCHHQNVNKKNEWDMQSSVKIVLAFLNCKKYDKVFTIVTNCLGWII